MGFDRVHHSKVRRGLARHVAAVAFIASGLTVGLAGTAFADNVPASSTVVASPHSVAANGATTSTITVTLGTNAGPTDTVSLVGTTANSASINGGAGGASASVAAVSGVATFTVTDTVAQPVTFQATDVTDGNQIVTATDTVTFVPTLATTGSFVTASSLGLTTATATLAHQGDVLVIWVQAVTSSLRVTAISGSGTGAIGTPVKATQYFTGLGHPNNDDEVWYVPVTTPGAITLTFTWSGSVAAVNTEYSTQQFQPSAPSTYSTGVANTLEVTAASLAIQFPSLTPAGPDELYAGYNSNNTSGVYNTPTPAGYSVNTSVRGDALLFNPNTTSAVQSPSATATSGASTQSAIGVMIIATAIPLHTVTFNANGGTGSMAPETHSTASALTTNTFTFTGRTFAGWNDAANGSGTAYADGATYPFTADVTLYAQWTLVGSHTVTFSANGGIGGLASQTANVPTNLTPFSAGNITRSGYNFAGWNTAADGSGTGYPDGGSYPFAANATLYAQWTAAFQPPPLTALTVTAGNTSVAFGATVTPSATVSGLATGDTASITTATYTYTGTGSTTYAASSTPPTAAGTYSVTPSSAAVAVSPSAHAGNYSTTYSYVAGSLTITPMTPVTPITLTITAASLTVPSGAPISSSSSVSNLSSGDIASVTAATYTYTGTGSTTYAASSTPPTAAGTYSVTPSAATIALSPSAHAGNYSTTYSYVAGTLTISAIPPVAPGLHATRLIGTIRAGATNQIVIVGTGFFGKPNITSNAPGTKANVTHDTGTRLTVVVKVAKSSPKGRHTFTITLVNGKSCKINYHTM